MALNLSTLTGATSGEVLAEALTTADFLEPCPVLRNLSRGSNKGGDAKQDVALNQPKALPLINGDGYLYLSGVSGNYASVPDESALDVTGDLTLECDFLLAEFPPTQETVLAAKYNTVGNQRSYQIRVEPTGNVRFILSEDGIFNGSFDKSQSFASELTSGTRATVKASWRQSDGRLQFFIKESDGSFTQVGADQNLLASGIYNGTSNLEIGSHNEGVSGVGDAVGVFGAKIYASINDTNKVLDVDFTATNVRHGDTKIKCATGQIVTINQDSSSSNDVATIIKKAVLRFDGSNSGLSGLFNQTITGGHFFAAFSVLGDGGDEYARIFSGNSTGSFDYQPNGFTIRRNATTDQVSTRWNGASEITHSDVFNGARGDFLLESPLKAGNQNSKINNADADDGASSLPDAIDSEEFNICEYTAGGRNAALDLEFLALFSADSVPDEATATKIRDYINKRNNVFSLVDNSYYFFDPQKATFTGNFTGANTLDGYITGSDNGDTDVRTNLTLEQSTLNDQPSTDGYTITFNDAAEHLEFENAASQNLSGWQVCGTSLGTFVYRVQGAVTELNLLGNAGSSRAAGDSYGIILLPESATGADIEEARSLLINRGAADGATSNSFFTYWSNRYDIVEFNHINTSSVTSMSNAWFNCQALSKFPLIDTSSVTSFNYTFYNTNLESFPAIQAPLCTEFTNTWQNCSSLTSFPAGAKLGTSAQNVNFGAAFMNSGLTSFPALDLSSGDNFSNTFRGTAITQFPSGALLGTAETNVNFNSAFRSSNIISFSTPLPTGNTFADSFKYCDDLTDVSVDVFTNWNPLSIANACFNDTWKFCTALTAQSVENILTSIDASGQHATSDGDAYVNGVNTQLADSGIDIDYNVATGSLSAATNTAIDSLSGKGWEVFINGVLVIPNILDLAPAAAYSLRSFDADADPNVVNVRRSSDNATSDFKASEVTDGTLTTWVNTDVDFVTPTLNNGDFEDGLTGWGFWSASADTNEFYAGTQSAKITVIGGGGAYIYKNNFSLQAGANYRVGFWAKISDASKQARVEFGSASNKEDISFTSTDWEYKEVTKTATAVTLAFNRQTGSGDYTINIDNVTVTQLTADGHVTTWYDQGGTNHAAQSDDAKQPKIVDGGTLVTDGSGNPAIIGDGVNDTLFHPTLTQSLDNTDFLVTAAYKNSLALGVSGGVPRLYMTQGAWSYNNLSSITFSNQSGRNVLSFQTNGDAQEVFGNGTSLGTGSEAQANFAFNGFNLMQAGSGFSNGFFMEVVVFDENQVSNRTGIENNINDTYTIY